MKKYLLAGMLSLSLLPIGAMAQDLDVAADPAAVADGTDAAATGQSTASTTPAVKPPRASNKWRIEYDESSKSDGTIIFRVWTNGTDVVDVPVAVRDNQSENSIARLTRDAFRKILGKGYKVETDDGEDVLIKATGKTKSFGLALVSSTAKDVDINLDRE